MKPRRLLAPSPRIMGVLNVTPDSFSDGGNYVTIEAALTHARELVRQGAHMIDVGGESTRPGAARVTPEEEQQRVLPIIEALSAEGFTVSIDTVNAATARLAVGAGATLLNDVSGGTADADMRAVAAETGATFIIMHWRGIPDPLHSRSQYTDVVEEVRTELAELADAAVQAGVLPENIVIDPGLGFDKTADQGWQLLASFDRLASLGYPVLVGVSRKRMLGDTLDAYRKNEAAGAAATERALGSQAVASNGQTLSDMHDRDVATAVVSAFAAQQGAWGVRVHDVRATSSALAVAGALATAEGATVSRSSNRSAVALGEISAPARATEGADCITLTGLEVFAHHGVFDFEREQGQRFVIDATVNVNLRDAARGDDLGRTVNYAQLAAAIHDAARLDPVDLIETLAERIAEVVLSFDGVESTTITVHKPDAPIDLVFGDVSVTVTRTRADICHDGHETGGAP